jgi:hypothetical protein
MDNALVPPFGADPPSARHRCPPRVHGGPHLCPEYVVELLMNLRKLTFEFDEFAEEHRDRRWLGIASRLPPLAPQMLPLITLAALMFE